MAFGGSGLIREVAFGGSGLIRGVAFGGSGQIMGEILYWNIICDIPYNHDLAKQTLTDISIFRPDVTKFKDGIKILLDRNATNEEIQAYVSQVKSYEVKFIIDIE